MLENRDFSIFKKLEATRPRRSLEVRQEAVGHRIERFRARMHPLNDPGQPGDDLGKFHFRSKNHHFS